MDKRRRATERRGWIRGPIETGSFESRRAGGAASRMRAFSYTRALPSSLLLLSLSQLGIAEDDRSRIRERRCGERSREEGGRERGRARVKEGIEINDTSYRVESSTRCAALTASP